jgi:hypothetical protein
VYSSAGSSTIFGDKAVQLPEEIERRFIPQRGIRYCDRPLPDFDRYVEAGARGFGKVGRIGNPIVRMRLEFEVRISSPGQGEHRAGCTVIYRTSASSGVIDAEERRDLGLNFNDDGPRRCAGDRQPPRRPVDRFHLIG